MKSIKTILSHDKNVAKFLSSEFPVCIRDCQFVKHGLRPANCIQSSLRSLFMRLLLVKHGLRPASTFATRFARCSCVCGLRQKKSAYKQACSRFFCLNPCFTNHPLLRCFLRKRWSVLRRSLFLPYWHRHTGIPTSWIQALSHSPGKGFRSLGSCSVDFPDT